MNTPRPTIGLGVFDGMHLGHQAIANLCDMIVTFSPHPDRVLGKNPTLQSLTTVAELRHLFPKVKAIRFTKALSTLSATDFLDTIILKRFNPKAIVIGYDFSFGQGRQGTLDTLKAWAAPKGIAITVIPEVQLGTTPVKSALIREALLGGDFTSARERLGHSYVITGTVVQGEQRGRTLGFPTANLVVPATKLVPSNGVYSGTCLVNHAHHNAMIYIGRKPTFGGKTAAVEVHLLDASPTLYGKTITVFMDRKIRGEMTFGSAEELVAQIRRDIVEAFG
ncbi:MAG: riboflavin biosynthesis protein RibF [Candidatus Margulisiibacteriota bacterium]